MIDTDLAIVGAGPAGLSAARVACAAGLEVVLLDAEPRPGGQYFRQPAPSFARAGASPFDSEPEVAARLCEVLQHPSMHWVPSATVWDLPAPGVLAFAAGEHSGRVRARALLLATGACDRAVPFPGWTLPGVISAGGLQNLVKGQRVLPGRRFVVAGNGPLLLAVAHNVLSAGGEIAAVVEAAPLTRNLPGVLPGLLAAPRLLALGVRYRLALVAHDVPLLGEHVVVSAQTGTDFDGVRSVTVAPLAADGRPGRKGRRVIECDTLVTGYGLAPATELARLAGCAMHFEHLTGAPVPLRDATLQGTVARTWLAGDGAGTGGAALAMAEGEVAAHAIVETLCARIDARASKVATARLARRRRFQHALASLYGTRADWLSLAAPETCMCRCEDVALADLRAMIAADPNTSMARIKAETRCGLGRCQGRNCLPTLAALLARARGAGVDAIDWPRARPPARPVSITDLLTEPLPPPDLPADPHLPRTRHASASEAAPPVTR